MRQLNDGWLALMAHTSCYMACYSCRVEKEKDDLSKRLDRKSSENKNLQQRVSWLEKQAAEADQYVAGLCIRWETFRHSIMF